MAERMTPEDILRQEKLNTGTSVTKNNKFEQDGYLALEQIWDPSELVRDIPGKRGQYDYWGKNLDQCNFTPIENQVEGSIASYWHPQYRSIHTGIRRKLEKIIGCKLYNTYYYDRFYFPGQELKIHADRPACEISISVHIASNIEGKWPLWIKTPNGERHSIALRPGDGMLYKGCERPHWRDPLPREYTKTWYGKKVEKEGLFYHQIFFHYVLADGLRSHFANDLLKGQL